MNKNKDKKSLYPKRLMLVLIVLFSFWGHAFASTIDLENVENSINQERSARGLTKLKIDPNLNNAANAKSKDMINRNYFEHYAFGLTPWDFIKQSGYNYLYAGENLAMDFSTSEGMMSAWMNSSLHRENVLNPDYTDMGIGIVKGEYTENGVTHSTTMVTNMFGRKKPFIIKAFDYLTQNIFHLF